MWERFLLALTKLFGNSLKKWKTANILEKLHMSYELQKKVFEQASEYEKRNPNRPRIIRVNLDISEKEYELFEKIGLNMFGLIEKFANENQQAYIVLASWENVEYKPLYKYEDKTRRVYRYHICFKTKESSVA